MLRYLLPAALLLAPLPSRAHQLWLERDGTALRAYFGEPVENVRERTGALLDRIAAPRVLGAPSHLTRKPDHIAFALPAGTGDARVVEDTLPPFGREGTPRTKGILLAREGRQDTTAAMDLELVPVTPGGGEFTLLLRGQPLPRAEVTVVSPPRWERRLRTDAQGRVSFPTPWAGRYVAETIHTEDTPGGSGAGAWARVRMVSTLSFTVSEGIAWAGP